MVLVFKKKSYADIPEEIRKRITFKKGREIEVDDTGLTRQQMQKLIDWFAQEGYVEQ